MSFPGLIDYNISELKQEFGGRKMPPEYDILSELIDKAENSLYEMKKIGMGKSDAYRLIEEFVRNAENELEYIAEKR